MERSNGLRYGMHAAYDQRQFDISGDAFQDGLWGEAGTLSMCSFWYVEYLARAGDLQQACCVFEPLSPAGHQG